VLQYTSLYCSVPYCTQLHYTAVTCTVQCYAVCSFLCLYYGVLRSREQTLIDVTYTRSTPNPVYVHARTTPNLTPSSVHTHPFYLHTHPSIRSTHTHPFYLHTHTRILSTHTQHSFVTLLSIPHLNPLSSPHTHTLPPPPHTHKGPKPSRPLTRPTYAGQLEHADRLAGNSRDMRTPYYSLNCTFPTCSSAFLFFLSPLPFNYSMIIIK
jgi:hypothetical protein